MSDYTCKCPECGETSPLEDIGGDDDGGDWGCPACLVNSDADDWITVDED